MPRSLVTGGAGFIGAHLTAALLDRGHDVVVLDDLSGGFTDNVDERGRLVEGSVTDHELIDDLFAAERFDQVFHCAAYAAEGLSHFIKRFNYTNNVIGSVNLINASVNHGVDCFVFTSSIAVYGAEQAPMTEDLVPRPEDPYGISKYAAELDLAAASSMFGLSYTVFRPHNVYGERQNISDRYRNVVGIFMNAVLRGQPMPVFGDGLQTRAFSHIDDVAPPIARSPLVPATANETYNIGADQPVSVLELAEMVADALGAPRRVEHLPPRNEVVHAFSDHAKVRAALDLGTPIDLHTGIGRMAEWVRAHGPREPVEFGGDIELPRNLPPSWAETVADHPGEPESSARDQ